MAAAAAAAAAADESAPLYVKLGEARKWEDDDDAKPVKPSKRQRLEEKIEQEDSVLAHAYFNRYDSDTQLWRRMSVFQKCPDTEVRLLREFIRLPARHLGRFAKIRKSHAGAGDFMIQPFAHSSKMDSDMEFAITTSTSLVEASTEGSVVREIALELSLLMRIWKFKGGSFRGRIGSHVAQNLCHHHVLVAVLLAGRVLDMDWDTPWSANQVYVVESTACYMLDQWNSRSLTVWPTNRPFHTREAQQRIAHVTGPLSCLVSGGLFARSERPYIHRKFCTKFSMRSAFEEFITREYAVLGLTFFDYEDKHGLDSINKHHGVCELHKYELGGSFSKYIIDNFFFVRYAEIRLSLLRADLPCPLIGVVLECLIEGNTFHNPAKHRDNRSDNDEIEFCSSISDDDDSELEE